MGRLKPACWQKRLIIGLALWLVANLLLACGNAPTLPPAPAPAELPSGVTPTPPFPAQAVTNAPTSTIDAPRVLEATAPPPPPLFPTSTPPPTVRAYDYTATAGVPAPNLTPASFPTGQLAYLQAGNLWLIDDTGGNRRQLTESGDIGGDSFVSWNNNRERMAYISTGGELWVVDLQGKRTQVFNPARQNRPGVVPLPPLPTALPPPTPDGATPRPVSPPRSARPGLQISNPLWSPDGRYLTFGFFLGEAGPLASGEVWLADLLTDKIALSRVGEGFGPGWGADGRSLAFLSRGEVKTGAPRPSPNLTPPGTSLLPPTRAAQSSDAEFETQATAQPTPTSFVVRPGSSIAPAATPVPGRTTTPLPTPNTPQPTPTLNLIALPSPSPTPTYPPVYLGTYITNKILTYSLASRKASVLLESDKLPDAFSDLSNTLRSYIPAPLQGVWWSSDGRYIAFGDRLSVVGIVPLAPGSAPVIWTGIPQGFATYDVVWLPRSDGAFVRYGSPYTDEISRLALITFPGGGVTGTGVPGDVTNRGLIKIDQMTGAKVSCVELSPGGNYVSYNEGTTLAILRPNGSVASSFSDAECAGWSPFGRTFAYARKTGDRSVILTDLERAQSRTLISARAVDRVFWLRVDPSTLGGPPPATPRP